MLQTKKIFFITLVVILTSFFFYLISPFFISIIISLLLVRFFKKTYLSIEKKVNNKNYSALLTTFLVLLVIFLPIIYITFTISEEVKVNYSIVESFLLKKKESPLATITKQFPILEQFQIIETITQEINTLFNSNSISNLLQKSTNWIINILKSTFLNISGILINFIIILYLFYYLIKDGNAFIEQIKSFIPLEENEKNEFIKEAIKTLDATIIGTLFIAIIEGFYGAIIFAFLGISSPLLWGAVMTIFSLLPILGTNGILFPLAIYELFIGHYLNAFFIFFIGCGGVLISQSIVKPKLLGNHSGIHPTIIVLSSIGGILQIGIIGFIIGPVISSLFIVCWKQFKNKLNIL